MKQDEMIKGIEHWRDWLINDGYGFEVDALTQAIDQLRWRSVEDELPETSKETHEGDYVLCAGGDMPPFVAWYNEITDSWTVAHWLASSAPVKVTHWMPLPEQP